MGVRWVIFTYMKLSAHRHLARIIFWFALAVGVLTSLTLLLFIGGNLVSELFNQLINFKEDYSVFLFFFCEALIAIAIIISLNRKRMGAILMLALTILIGIIWGREDINIILLHLPLLVSGLLLFFNTYYKEWIAKQ
jgi:hypothetical protein